MKTTLIAAAALAVLSQVLAAPLEPSTSAEYITVSGIQIPADLAVIANPQVDPEYKGDTSTREYIDWLVEKHAPVWNVTEPSTVGKRVGPFPNGAECRVQVNSEMMLHYNRQGTVEEATRYHHAMILNHHNPSQKWWAAELVDDDLWRTYGISGARGARFRINSGLSYALKTVHFEPEGKPGYKNMAQGDWCWNEEDRECSLPMDDLET